MKEINNSNKIVFFRIPVLKRMALLFSVLLFSTLVSAGISSPSPGQTIWGIFEIQTVIINSAAITVDISIDGKVVTTVPKSGSLLQFNYMWDTTTVANGTHKVAFKALNAKGKMVGNGSEKVKILNTTPPNVPSNAGGGFYWGVRFPPVTGPVIWVGPYPTKADCADMYGSTIYSHPWECHLTGDPSDCGITGNGFGYPKSWIHPVPADQIMVGTDDLNCTQQSGANNPNTRAPGWYFLFYTPSGPEVIGAPTVGQCQSLYNFYKNIAPSTPGDEVGYYSDLQCPGAPCFSVGFDSACE